jgi:hypothetical protein
VDERLKLPHYDPDYCRKVAKWAASVCVGILVIEVLVLLFVTPSTDRCPEWTIYTKNGAATPAWILVGMITGGPTIWICYVTMRWEHFSERMYESLAYEENRSVFFSPFRFGNKSKLSSHRRERSFEEMFLLNFNGLFLRVNIFWCLFCAFPLLMIITECTNATRYLAY